MKPMNRFRVVPQPKNQDNMTETGIGNKLKMEREKRGLTLDDVHAQIRIHPEILSNLEENRFDALPAAIYTKGFLKHYCEFLNLNSDELMDEYEKLNVRHKEQSLVLESKDKSELTGLFPDLALPRARTWIKSNRRVLLTVLGVVLAIFIALKLIGGVISLGKSWFSNGPTGQRVEEQRTVDKRKLQEEIRKNSPYLHSLGQGNYPKIGPKEPLQLKIRAKTAVWLRVASDGIIVFESIMRPGQFKRWQASKMFDVQLGRPEGAEFTVNDFLLGTPGDGTAKHVIVNRKGVREI